MFETVHAKNVQAFWF